ncbi:MAG: Ig-like domain-containing protein [Bacteroidota bacterium]
MKKIYIIVLCFGIVLLALGIPNIGKLNSFIKKAIVEEKVRSKPIYTFQKKVKLETLKNNFESKNIKVAAVDPSVSIVQSVTVEGGGNAAPGGQLNFSFLISNTGTEASGITFTDQLISDLTLVGSVLSTPIAGDDSYSSIGNVGIAVPAVSGVLANDNSPTNVAMTVGILTSPTNGSATLAADGGFTYTPTAGYVGSDSFTYTLTTGATSSTGTVNISVSDMIWFVNPAAGASGTGTLQSPFKNMSDVVGTSEGNTIFVYSGSPTGALTLLDNQKLVGQGASASLVSISGIAFPSFSNALPSTGGINPIWTNSGTTLTLATTNDVEGLDINTTGGITVSGASVGALKVREVSLSNADGQSLQILAGGLLDVEFKSISSTGGSTGISVANSTGYFQITGSGTDIGSGGTISGKSARGAEFLNCTNITLKNIAFTNASTTNGLVDVSNNSGHNAAIHLGTVAGATLTNIQISGTTAQHGINLNNVSSLDISNSTVSNCGDEINENCLTAYGLSGTCSITNSTFQFAAHRVAYIFNAGSQNLNLNVDGSNFNDVNTDVTIGGDAFFVYLAGSTASGSSTVNVTNSNFLRSIGAGFHGKSEGNAVLNLNINGSTISSGTGIGLGIVAESLGNGSGRSKINFNIGTNSPNNISSRAGLATNFLMEGKSDGEGRLQNNIIRKNNVIGSDNVGAYVRAIAQEFSTLKIDISNNNCEVIDSGGGTITQYGFDIFSRGGTSGGTENARVDAIITNNVVKVNSALQAINIASGASEPGTLNLTTCARVANNTTVQSNINARSFRLRVGVLGAFVTLDEGSVVNGNADDAAIGAYWDFKNNTPINSTNANTVVLSSIGGAVNPFRTTTSSVCLSPSNPGARLGVNETIAENKNTQTSSQEAKISQGNTKKTTKAKKVTLQTQQSLNSQAQSGELITVNGSGSGFSLPQGKSTTITFSATIAAMPTVCELTNYGTLTNPSLQSNTTSTPLVDIDSDGDTIANCADDCDLAIAGISNFNTSTCSCDAGYEPIMNGNIITSCKLCNLVVDAGPECKTVYSGYNTDSNCTILTATASGEGSSGYTYTWSNGATGASITVCPTANTTYTVTATKGGCSATDFVNVEVIDVSCDKNKVNVCHNGHTICISKEDVATHLLHGDKLGACGTVICEGSGAKIAAEVIGETDKFNDKSVQVSPVPTHEQIILKLQNMNNGLAQFDIRNTAGKLAQSESRMMEKGYNEVVIDTRKLNSGMYFIQIKDAEKKTIVIKMIKN